MFKIKKNDTAQAIKGKDKGKKGRVLQVIDEGKKAIVEGINVAKKHKRQTRQDQKGGIVHIELPIAIGNLMVVCKSCNRPVRVGFKAVKGQEKTRFCKSCKEVL
jgi:large subunit ribosomal protein L24